MKRLIVLLTVVAAASLAASGVASAYVLLSSTDNVSLSVEWSETLFPISPFGTDAADSAIIVRHDAFADALAAGALAGTTDSPVLLHPRAGGLDPSIAAELDRLAVTRVWIIGGTAAVSTETEDALTAAGYAVQRLAGADRTATSASVFEQAMEDDGTLVFDGGFSPFFPYPEVYLTRAFGPPGAADGPTAFADALGAGMLAGSTSAPLLTTHSTTLSTATREALEAARADERYGRVIIIGGTSAISNDVEAELIDIGYEVDRIAGATRYDTAALLAAESFQDGPDPHLVAVVDGADSNSWASGFPASASAGGAVILSNGADLPEASDRFLLTVDQGDVVCAPEVPEAVCAEVETLVER